MSQAGDIYALLHSTAVDGLIAERVYPTLAPPEVVRPYAVWRRNGGEALPVLGGATQGRSREVLDVFVGAYGEKFDDADALAEALRDAVMAGSSTLRPGTVTPPLDGFEESTKLFSIIFQARLFYRA